MRNRREGEYFYGPHRRMWGVWINHNHPSGVSTGDFVKDFAQKEDARNFVYEKNGWNNETTNINN